MDTEKLSSAGVCSTFARDDDEREMLPIAGTTDQGQWTISGCHDMGPELETEG